MSLLRNILSFAGLLLFISPLTAQPPLADVQLKNMKNILVSFSSLSQKDSVILVCFWSINSDASVEELNAINGHYEKWEQAVHFKMMAVCIDEGNSLSRIRSAVSGNGWVFDVYADINGDLHKALNGGNLPQAMVLRGGQVIYQQSGFEAGSENYLFSKIREQALAPSKN